MSNPIEKVFGGIHGQDCKHRLVARVADDDNRWTCGACGARFVPALDIYYQVDQGLLAEHDCPALFACASILTECIDGNTDAENKLLGLERIN